ncbi:unnamed protein product [Caenorhabditis brenneri]
MFGILKIAQYFGFIFTEVSNLLLFYLIVAKASTRFGTYKYLMISYAVYSIVYGVVEICTQPIIHVYGAGMYLYVDSFLKYEKTVSNILAAGYCGTFGLCVSLLATHFVYRYFAVCRPQDLHYFDGWNLLRIYIIPTSASMLWFWAYYCFLGPTDIKSEFVRAEIQNVYDEDIRKMGYVAPLYYVSPLENSQSKISLQYTDKTGKLVIDYMDFVSVFIACGVMQVSIVTMIICGWKTFRKMKNVEKSMSQRTRELNKQLFQTLVLQTLVPMCTMFAPVGSLLIMPMFSIGVGSTYSNASSFYACLYPALDATIVIFMIRDFRDTVLCRKRVHPSLINTSTLSGQHLSSHLSSG